MVSFPKTAQPKLTPLTKEQFERLEHRAWAATIDKGKTRGEYAIKLKDLIEKHHGVKA